MALLYAKRPISAIVAIMSVDGDAVIDRKQEQFARDPYWCNARIESVLETPLTFRSMRADKELRTTWGLVRSQFQSPGGRPPKVDATVIELLANRIPELGEFGT